ncbi:MAG: DOPA 4,5-dioxygenase family protein [Betaproteobacteria bacterium]
MPRALAAIASFHAQVYFHDEAQRERALALREQIGDRFQVTPMYQVAFAIESFGKFVPWLMLNRQGLTVLVHPNTRDERSDHVVHALWMGEMLAIVGSS